MNFKRLLVLLVISAGICSCNPFEIGKRKSPLSPDKTAKDGLETTDVRRLEYYRGYIERNLPFKKILWEAVFSGEKIRKLTRLGDSLYVETYANRLYSTNIKNGFRQWQFQLPAPIDFFISTLGDLPKKELELRKNINTTEKEIADESKKKDKDEDKIKLLKTQLRALKQEFVFLRSKDVIYLTCRGGLYCIDRFNGNLLWQSRLAFVPATTPCSTIASIFIGALDYYRVYQVDASLKYEKNWFKADEPISTTPLYENLVIYFASQGGKVYAYDTIQNKLLWSYQTEKSIKTDMILDEDVLFVGSADFAVYAIDRYAGILIWKFETGGSILSPLVLDKKPPGTYTDKTLYVYSDKNGLYAIDFVTISIKPPGAEVEKVLRRAKARWKFEDGKSFLIRGVSCGYVIGLDNRTLYAVTDKDIKGDSKADVRDGDGAISIANPEVKKKYSLALFPVRYGDLEESTVYLATPDGYIFAVQEP